MASTSGFVAAGVWARAGLIKERISGSAICSSRIFMAVRVGIDGVSRFRGTRQGFHPPTVLAAPEGFGGGRFSCLEFRLQVVTAPRKRGTPNQMSQHMA